MKKLISLMVIILFFTSCDKDKTYLLKGRLIYDCDAIPVPNAEVELRTNADKYYTTSDDNGYFSIVYNKGSQGELRINKVRKLDGLLLQVGKEKDLGDVYVGGTIDLIVKLQVNNPHTQNDTLIFWDLESNDYTQKISIPGPFTDGIVYTFTDGYFPNFPIFYGESPRLSFGHYFHPYTDIVYTDVNVSFCDMNEITLVID